MSCTACSLAQEQYKLAVTWKLCQGNAKVRMITHGRRNQAEWIIADCLRRTGAHPQARMKPSFHQAQPFLPDRCIRCSKTMVNSCASRENLPLAGVASIQNPTTPGAHCRSWLSKVGGSMGPCKLYVKKEAAWRK